MWIEHGGSRIVCVAVLALLLAAPVMAQAPPEADGIGLPGLGGLVTPASDREGVSTTLQILVLLTVLSLVPAILIMVTSFTRIVVVLALLRQAIGTQQLPPGQVMIGLAVLLTAVVMAPTWEQVNRDALMPYLDSQIGQREALARAVTPLRDFMIRQIETADSTEGVYMFLEHSRGAPWPADVELKWQDVPTMTLVPSFILSELKVAFLMGFRVYLPFLVIDMVIASILISMGMMMLPPVLISLPFKILLFVLVDGWHLVVETLLNSFS